MCRVIQDGTELPLHIKSGYTSAQVYSFWNLLRIQFGPMGHLAVQWPGGHEGIKKKQRTAREQDPKIQSCLKNQDCGLQTEIRPFSQDLTLTVMPDGDLRPQRFQGSHDFMHCISLAAQIIKTSLKNFLQSCKQRTWGDSAAERRKEEGKALGGCTARERTPCYPKQLLSRGTNLQGWWGKGLGQDSGRAWSWGLGWDHSSFLCSWVHNLH